VIRANRGEAAALLGEPGRVRGVESIPPTSAEDGEALARGVAVAFHCVAAVTGFRNDIADGVQHTTVDRGHPWLGAVSGAGCMVTALVGVFCAVSDDRFDATVAALTAFGAAAEIAARRAAGPGTLVPALVDALYHLSADELRQPAARGRSDALRPEPLRDH
jgi:hydroxyethylthiazole kinase